jgi:N-acyl-D-aspartate/D-glutamate deacylase
MTAHGDEAMRIYRDPAFRAAVKEELSKPARRMFTGEWDKIHVVQVARPGNRRFEGKSLQEIMAQTGKHPIDFLLDLSLEEGLDTVYTAILLNSDEQAVGRMIRDPHSLLSLSDAGAHLTFLCDAGFGLHFLGHWVRGKSLMPFEQGVKAITSYPAQVFGIPHRGRIAPGAWADLLLFDPATVGRGEAYRVRDLPAGASRLTTEARGLHGVWVNGQKVADAKGLVAGARLKGKVLREFSS